MKGKELIAERLRTVYDRIKRLEPKLHALLATIQTEPNESDGSLAGLVGTIKDVIVTEGIETTAGSKMLKGWIPPYEATLVRRLCKAGATLVGKNNCDAWAHGSSTENSDYGPTKNPWDTSRVPGGSSGGSAAAVAAGYGDFSIGTDTGGSIRQPAALCGVTGLKPTYGRVSRYGLVAMASSLDCPGPLARDAATCARILEVIAGHDPLDATSVPNRSFAAARITSAVNGEHLGGGTTSPSHPLKGLKIGIPKEYFADGLASAIRERVRTALGELEQLGATLVEVSLPSMPYALAAYYIIQPAEVSSNLARYDGLRFGHSVAKSEYRMQKTEYRKLSHIDLVKTNRAEGFGAEAKRRIILGTFVLSAGYVDAYYKKAMRVRTLLREDFTKAFEQVDVIATPTTPNPAFKIGEKTSDPLAMYLEDIYTVSANLVGIPALSVPCGFVQTTSEEKTVNSEQKTDQDTSYQIPDTAEVQLPVGLQLLGPMWGEESILRAAYWYQQTTDWHSQKPPLQEITSQKPELRS